MSNPDVVALEAFVTRIQARDRAALNFDAIAETQKQLDPNAKTALMLDTNVIILGMKRGKLTTDVKTLLATAESVASTVVIGELNQGAANLDPTHPDTPATRAPMDAAIAELSKLPIITPNHEDWLTGMVMLSTLGRCFNLNKEARGMWLRDALIYVTARRVGATLVTADLLEFDLFQQILPGGLVLFI